MTYAPAVNSITYWGAKVDGRRRYDAHIGAGALNVLRCDGYAFTTADVGKTIIVGNGSGTTPVAASSTTYQALITTIASISGSSAVLAASAANALDNVWIAWGSDDGPAWAAAITAAINTNAQLAMPAGLSICGQAISLAPTNSAVELFSLRGATIGTSEILSTSSGGFLTLDLTGTYGGGGRSKLDFRDLTLETAVAGASHALSVTVNGGGVGRGYTAENIICRGFSPLTGSGYWDKPIEVIGLFFPYLRNVIVSGLTQTWGTFDMSDTSPWFMATVGINLNECFAPEVTNSWAVGFKRGIQLIATVNTQGGFFHDLSVFNCREGFYCKASTSFGQPQFTIKGGCWGGNRDYEICFDTRQGAIISDIFTIGFIGTRTQSSTLTTAVTTGSSPTTLTFSSTAGFPAIGAVLIGNEWFTYNNIASGMNGTTLNNVVRAQFGTSDPGSNYAIGTTGRAATMDIILINTYATRINNATFWHDFSNNRINVLLHSANAYCSVANSFSNTRDADGASGIANGIGILAAVGNDSISTVTSNNTCTYGTIPVLARTTGVTQPATFPSYDNSATSSHLNAVASGTASTMSYTAAANAGIVVALYANTGGVGGPAAGDTATVTFGGQPLTSKGWIYDATSQTQPWQWIFTLDNQPGGSGSQTLSVTLHGHALTGYIAVASYTNVTKIGALQTRTIPANNTTPNLPVTATFPGDILWASVLASAGSTTFSSPTFTQRQTANFAPSFLMGDTTGVLGFTTLAATLNTAESWSVAALDIQ